MSRKIIDAVIIGAGPIGLACGIEAARRGIEYLIIEKGCLVNSVFNYPTNMTFFSTSDKIELGNVPFVSHGTKPTRREALEYYRRVTEAKGLIIKLYERVNMIEKQNETIRVTTNKSTYLCRNLIIATGYYDNPNMMNIPGEQLSKVKHFFDEAHPYAGLEATVVGAGNSAVDVALELFRIGAKVTMVVREEGIKKSVKYWVRPDIENRIAEGSIKAFFRSSVIEIEAGHILIDTPQGKTKLRNDVVFAMTGYHPDLDFMKEAGIRIVSGKKGYFSKMTHETNTEGIYLAGVACSGGNTDKYFIENSIIHSVKIMDHIQKKMKAQTAKGS